MAKYSPSATKFASSLLALFLLAPAPTLAAEDEDPPNRVRSAEAVQPHQGPGGATIWIDPTKWTWVRSDSEDAMVFVYQTGMAQARLVSNDEPANNEELLEGLITRLKKIDPEPKVLFQETRRINGVDMLCAQVQVNDGKRDVVYYGVARGGENGSLELFTVTWAGLLGGYYEDLTKIIEGLELPAASQP